MSDVSQSQAQSAINSQRNSAGPNATTGCQQQVTWIEIRLIDMEGNPVPQKKYQITTPDGNVVSGALDSDGLARVDNIPPGTCKITFPELDQDAWDSV